ncbi:hypothetical protein ACLEJQ_22395 [Pseudomonas sp. SMV71]|uniref:hypothetical protein n=1 Tax=Pseudomonas sp. SMV71 TaxID=3390195 RepID=UPI003F85DBB8
MAEVQKLVLARSERGVYILFTEDGKVLPKQISTQLVAERSGLQKLIVTFACDGDGIRVIGDPEDNPDGGKPSDP